MSNIRLRAATVIDTSLVEQLLDSLTAGQDDHGLCAQNERIDWTISAQGVTVSKYVQDLVLF